MLYTHVENCIRNLKVLKLDTRVQISTYYHLKGIKDLFCGQV